MSTWQIIVAVLIIIGLVIVAFNCLGSADIDQDMPSRPDEGRQR